MKYAVAMASSGTIHIPIFIKIGSGVQKLLVRDTRTDTHTHTHTHTQTAR
jgi:hypothetical protein